MDCTYFVRHAIILTSHTNRMIEFLTSPDFAQSACLLIGGALLGAGGLTVYARLRAARERRARRNVRFLSR